MSRTVHSTVPEERALRDSDDTTFAYTDVGPKDNAYAQFAEKARSTLNSMGSLASLKAATECRS